MKTLFLFSIKRVAIQLGMMLMSMMIATLVHAESAPVYDADSMPAQFDDAVVPQQQSRTQGQQADSLDLLEDEQAFVPMESMQSKRSAVRPAAGSPNMDSEQRPKREKSRIDANPEQVESLQQEVQTLRNQVEQLSHQLQQVEQQQKSQYSDLDKRLTQTPSNEKTAVDKSAKSKTKDSEELASNTKSDITVATENKTEAKSSAVTKQNEKKLATKTEETVTESKVLAQPNVAEEQQIYQTAYTLIKAKKYNEAIDTLQNMLKKYPMGQFASNAYYWLGELYGLLDKKDQALSAFNTVVKSYPESPRVIDAQLKVGILYASQFKWSEAKLAFKKIVNKYPGTGPSRIAAEQLKQIKTAGH